MFFQTCVTFFSTSVEHKRLLKDVGKQTTLVTLIEEKVLYRTLKVFYQRYVFGTPKRFYTLLKRVPLGSI